MMYHIMLAGDIFMLKSKESLHKSGKWKTAAAAAVILLALLAAAAGLAVKFYWGQKEIDLAAAAILFLTAALIGQRRGAKQKTKRLLPALLCGLILCAVLLTLGFLIGGEAITASGLLRVMLPSFLGAAVGSLLPIRSGGSTRAFPARSR